MGYINVEATSYSEKEDMATVEGISLDDVLLNPWNKEFDDNAKRVYRFDLGTKGARIYLFKLLRSNLKKEFSECSSMEELLHKLPGKITSISDSFLLKEA